MSFEYKQYYRRKLPHIHSPGATFFVTFRLHGAIPRTVLREWRAKRDYLMGWLEKSGSPDESLERLRMFNREWFARLESILDNAEFGPTWLKDERVAKQVYDSILHRDGKQYDLSCFCIMSNHAHMVVRPYVSDRSIIESRDANGPRFKSENPTMPVIMQSLKGYTARKANQILGRNGQFWDAESYDHEIRNGEEFGRIFRYVINNPVKAGIVMDWREYPWTWVRNRNDKNGRTG
jgi:putative transposase